MADMPQNTNPSPSAQTPSSPSGGPQFSMPPKVVNAPVAPLAPRPPAQVPPNLPGATPTPVNIRPAPAPAPTPTTTPSGVAVSPVKPFQPPVSTVTPPVKPYVAPQSADPKGSTFATPIPPRTANINPQPAPLYSRPSQNTTEPSRPDFTGLQAPRTGQTKEYKSSIRTMSDDISKIKVGQQPAGFDIQKTINPVSQPAPKAPLSPGSAPTMLRGPVSGSSAIPVIPVVPRMTPAAPTIKPSITVPQAGLPSASVPTQAPPTVGPKPGLPSFPRPVAPPQPGSGGPSKLIILVPVVILVLVTAGGAYWWYASPSPSPEIVETTPTPEPTLSGTPAHRDLTAIFGASSEAIPLAVSSDTVGGFLDSLTRIQISGAQFKEIMPAGEPVEMGFIELLDRMAIVYPTDLKNSMRSDKIMLLYGQREVFDARGKAGFANADANLKRFVFVTEIQDAVNLLARMRSWEATMTTSLARLFGLDPAKSGSNVFGDNTYQGIALRYLNFPYADQSIDYAIVRATDGKEYIVISSSREAIYAAINKLK